MAWRSRLDLIARRLHKRAGQGGGARVAHSIVVVERTVSDGPSGVP